MNPLTFVAAPRPHTDREARIGLPMGAPSVVRLVGVVSVLLINYLAAPASAKIVAAAEQPDIVGPPAFARVLVLPTPGPRTRSLVRQDAIEAALVKGDMPAPRSGDSVQLPDGKTVRWEAAELDDAGRIQHPALRGGYLAATVRVDRDQIALLTAKRCSFAVVNGRSLAGDPYGYGFVVTPIFLREGENSLLFRCGRGELTLALETPASGWMLLEEDPTLPDIVVGEEDRLLGAAVVLNATVDWVDDLALRIRTKHQDAVSAATEFAVPALAPLTLRKVPFRFDPPAGIAPDDSVGLRLELVRAGEPVGGACEFPLRVRARHQSTRRTFISEIDGSVQFYTIQPRRPAQDDGRPPALFLSLHGAAVDSAHQASCYQPKTWGDLVAPQNRRPFGFDWEDWGRIDALEVLALASRRLGSDPLRTYLTGHSMGGHGTWQVGALYPDRFAAIGPSAGWVSFRSYSGSAAPLDDDPVATLLHRAAGSSDTLALFDNYLTQGVYVLHGDQDDNVPVSEARFMREQLGRRHTNFAYYERLGAGHWWGNQCMDWPPLFQFFAQNERKPPHEVDRVDFVTVNPAISDRHEWVSVRAQRASLLASRVSLTLDRAALAFTGTTENIQRLAIDLDRAFDPSLAADAQIHVTLDETQLEPITVGSHPSRRLLLELEQGHWRLAAAEPADEKGLHRAGPFKEAFRNRVLLVVGTAGTPEENAWALAKAGFDAATFWYRGNGSFDVVCDDAFDVAATANRNVILYGNAETNLAWDQVLSAACPLRVDRRGITIGERRVDGPDLALLAVYPRRGSDVASVGIIAGTGLEGCRTTDRLPIFVSGVGIPDWVVISSGMFTEGIRGIPAAGFFDHAWRVDEDPSAWRLTPPRSPRPRRP
jgi:pimeloyl-ACP methyl ester carboxylesterase